MAHTDRDNERTSERAARAAHRTVDQVSERAVQFEDDIRDKAEKTAERAREGTERATRAAHETIDRVGDRAARAEDLLREKAEQTAERAREVREEAAARVDSGVADLTSYIERNPLTAAALAFAAGVVVTSLLSRR